MINTVSILGCGWFGLPFAKALVKEDYLIKGSTTRQDKLQSLKDAGLKAYLIDTSVGLFDDEFFECDLLLINIPPRKKIDDPTIYQNDVREMVARAKAACVKRIWFVSSTGIFPDNGAMYNELDTPKPNTLAGEKLMLAEKEILLGDFEQTAILRFAGLIGPQRNLAKFFAGRNEIANGLAPINLLHLQDAIGFCSALLKRADSHGIYHVVSPSHPSRKDFYSALCQSSQMEKPTFMEEQLGWKQIDSNQDFYRYQINDWLVWAERFGA